MRLAGALVLLVLAGVLAGCIGADDAADPAGEADPEAAANDSWARPLPEPIDGLEPVASAQALETARGVVAHGDHVYASGAAGFHVVDVSDPEAPVVTAVLPELASRDVDILHYEDGRTVAVLANNPGGGMTFADVTDPQNPQRLAGALEDTPVHNVAVVPNTSLVYNSRTALDGEDAVDIVDASDPTDPEVARVATEVGQCHDITFRVEGDRAYCAFEPNEIWDISDPEHPKVVARIHNPAFHFPHWAVPAQDGDLLVIGAEWTGANTYGCGARAANPATGGDASDPLGALWFYDITDEANPRPLSWLSVDAPTDEWDGDPAEACTSHFGEVVPDRDKLVVGWYVAGTFLVDFSDPSAPAVVDHWRDGSDTWDARVHNGYVFTGDGDRGMDVLTLTGGR